MGSSLGAGGMPRKTYAKASLLAAAADDENAREDDSASSPQAPAADGSAAEGDGSSVDTVVLSSKEARPRSPARMRAAAQHLGALSVGRTASPAGVAGSVGHRGGLTPSLRSHHTPQTSSVEFFRWAGLAYIDTRGSREQKAG